MVLILNTRRKIKGHYFVSVGTMDTIFVHPREVFRLAIMASAHAIVIMHIIRVASQRRQRRILRLLVILSEPGNC